MNGLTWQRARAAWWVLGAIVVARAQIRRSGIEGLAVRPAPQTPHEARSWAQTLVRVLARNCLTRSAVRQAWYAGQGRPVDLVVGVTPPSVAFRAHAWLEIDDPAAWADYCELARRAPRLSG